MAQHGPESEQVLLDHNGGEIEFMLPTSRYYTFYQAQVRFHHWQVLKQVYEYQQKFEVIKFDLSVKMDFSRQETILLHHYYHQRMRRKESVENAAALLRLSPRSTNRKL